MGHHHHSSYSDVVIDVRKTPSHPSYQEAGSNYRSPSGWLSIANRRQQALTGLQQLCKQHSALLTEDSFRRLFSRDVTFRLSPSSFSRWSRRCQSISFLFVAQPFDQKKGALELVFHLLDYQAEEKLSQSNSWKGNSGQILSTYSTTFPFWRCIRSHHRTRGREFVDLFDTLAYVIADDSDLDFTLFRRILLAKGVREYHFNIKKKRILRCFQLRCWTSCTH